MEEVAKFRRGGHGEEGVLLPLLAIMSVLVLSVLVGLGFDSAKIKRASTALTEQNEILCRTVAARAVIQKEAASSFQGQISQIVNGGLLPAGTTLFSARLTIPTMPGDGQFCAVGDAGCTAEEPFVSDRNGHNFGDLGITACDLRCSDLGPSCHSDCIFQGEVAGDPNFPPAIWSDTANAGNTATCQLDAVVKTWFPRSLFSGPTLSTKISARSTWWIPVRGSYSLANGDIPGLTLAVAPQMTTDAADPRFRFCNDSEPNCGSNEAGFPRVQYAPTDSDFRRSFDPLYNYNPAIPKPSGFSQVQPHPITEPGGTRLIQPDPISGTIAHETYGYGGGSGDARKVPPAGYGENISCGEDPTDPNCLIPSDREQMLAACMNPAIFLRNSLLTTLAELATRHGQLRSNTEVLMVGTANRLTSGYAQSGGPVALNNPVALVPFGQDLARAQYQLPFVTYDGGTFEDLDGSGPGLDHSLAQSFRPAQGGQIDPWDNGKGAIDQASDAAAYERLKKHHALIANQLRYCYHLFHGTAANGKERPMPADGAIENSQFEPVSSRPDAYGLISKARTLAYPQDASDRWDQENPWSSNFFENSRSRTLNAAELLSVLGAVQKCPYEQGGLPLIDRNSNELFQVTSCDGSPRCPPFSRANPPYADAAYNSNYYPSGICKKPLYAFGVVPTDSAPAVYNESRRATRDLRPDILGLLKYLARQAPPGAFHYVDSSGNQLPPPSPLQALKMPGLFPMAYASSPPAELFKSQLSDPWHPLGSLHYSSDNASNVGRPILIVLHQRLAAGERNAIREMIDAGDFNGRPITVIYIPTDELNTQIHEAAVADLRQAFKISTSVLSDNREANALFILSPYIARYNPENSESIIIYPEPSPTYAGPAWARYRRYWKDLITNPKDNIDTVARNIFYSRILREDIKF